MRKDDDTEALDAAKVALFVSSLVIGAAAGSAIRATMQSTVLGVASGLVVAIANPFVAATWANWCEQLHKAAFPRTFQIWSPARRANHGAAWPFTGLYWCIISVFFITIDRAFRDLDHNSPAPSKPAFVVEVAPAQPSPELLIKDVVLTHPGCGGGVLKLGYQEGSIQCQRCHHSFSLHAGEHSVGAICKTALDGKPRTLFARAIPEGYSSVIVRQRTELTAILGAHQQQDAARRPSGVA